MATKAKVVTREVVNAASIHGLLLTLPLKELKELTKRSKTIVPKGRQSKRLFADALAQSAAKISITLAA